MLRLLHLIHDNRLGGISKRALTVAEELRSREVEPIFAVPNEDGEVDALARASGFETHRLYLPRPSLRLSHWVNSFRWLVSLPLSTWIIVRLLRSAQIDVVHVNGLVNVPAFLASAWTGCPLIVHLCGTDYPPLLCRLLMPWIARHSTVIAISPNVRDFFYENGRRWSPAIVLFEPVDMRGLEARVTTQERTTTRKALGIGPDERVCLSVGNVSERKGFHHLINAAERLHARGLRFRLLLVGAFLGGHETYLARLRVMISTAGLEDVISLLGKRNDIPALLRAVDCFALVSRSEGTPLVIMEAMAAGTPVVASAVGGVPDMFEDGTEGLLVPYGQLCQLEDTLGALMEDADLRHRLAENARKVAIERFALTHHVDVFCAIVHRAVTH